MKLCLLRFLSASVPGLMLALLAAGCSSFESAWRQASQTVYPTNTMAGPWEGSWRSEVTAHHDQLRCLVAQETNGVFSARFHAQYKKLFRFSFSYTVRLAAQLRDRKCHFEGEADLGWYAGGIYRYRGFATATNFFSSYESKYDHGTFQMTRPRPANPPH